MKLPKGFRFNSETTDSSTPGLRIFTGVMELPEGYDERATVIELDGDTLVYLADGRNFEL